MKMMRIMRIMILVLMVTSFGNTREDTEMVIKNMNARLTAAEKELLNTKTELEAANIKQQELEREVSALSNLPFLHVCGSSSTWLTISSQTISYRMILYSSTNTEGGGLDLISGIFTSPHPGSYTVTWSLHADAGAGDPWVEIYLRKNSQIIGESLHRSRYTGTSGFVRDQGREHYHCLGEGYSTLLQEVAP